ncbi:C4-dicarboxylate ABC transporter [Deltaproteobacteria bacterium]|nr:C4-dicarboxylate ABC transporter [Deltaproteobacteria bacterium]
MFSIPVEVVLFGMFIALVIGLSMGHQLAFVLGGIGIIAGLIGWGPNVFAIVVVKLYDTMDSYSSVAIPMFVLMANFLTHSNVAEGLFDSIRYVFGGMSGGLGIAVIAVSTVFAATTGIVGASVVTMGLLGVPILMKYGYRGELIVGTVCAGGSLGILIPPSIMLVMMGSFANVSVGKLFLAAIGPGLLLSICYMLYIWGVCKRHPEWGPAMSPEELRQMPLKKRITGSLVNLVPPLVLILGVLGSIFTGVATPTEASGVGAFMALLLTVGYRRFSIKMLINSLLETTKTSAMVFTILFGANAFVAIFMALRGDKMIADFVISFGVGGYSALVLMLFITFVLGMFLDWLGIVMLVFPIFLPILDFFKFDRLWVVALCAVILQSSFLTPPFGYALFYIRGIVPPSITIETIYRGVIPFVLIIVLVTFLCIVFPDILMYLPAHSKL